MSVVRYDTGDEVLGLVKTEDIEPGAITDGALAADVKVGSLGALLTGVKTSVVGAINWLMEWIADNVYTKTELASSGEAAVHWDNITNVPDAVGLLHATKPGQFLFSNDGETFVLGRVCVTLDGQVAVDRTGNVVMSL